MSLKGLDMEAMHAVPGLAEQGAAAVQPPPASAATALRQACACAFALMQGHMHHQEHRSLLDRPHRSTSHISD